MRVGSRLRGGCASTAALLPSPPLLLCARRHTTTDSTSASQTPQAGSQPTTTTATTSTTPAYYNFQSLHLYPGSGDAASAPPRRGGRRLSSSLHLHQEDHLPLENTLPVADDDPYKDLRIFRRDMVEFHGASKGFPLSVDVSLKKFIDMFCDYEGKRCKLCNETFLQWHSHQGAIPHAGREGVLLELVRAYCGTPEEIVKMWWHRLDTAKSFCRIPALSHANSHIRKRRLQFLLRFLKDRQIVKDTFNVMQSAAAGAGRTWEFERLEWVGDNVVKYIFNNRLNCVFPVREGGIRGKLAYSQFMIDGNDGLARAYDFLELQQLTQSDRVVSKFKSDVVETLFGELQLYLWSTEIDGGTEYHPMPFTKDMFSVRALVAHVMEELGHVMFMYHVEYLHSCLQRVVREHQLQFVRADPALRTHAADLSASDHAASYFAKKAHAVATSTKLSPTKVQHSTGSSSGGGGGGGHGGHHSHHGSSSNSGCSLFMESANYDGFKRVIPLGGLLPRPFAVSELAVTPAYMPHLQVALSLTESVQQAGITGSVMEEAGKETGKKNKNKSTANFYALSSVPQPLSAASSSSGGVRLDINKLKDEDLITELI